MADVSGVADYVTGPVQQVLVECSLYSGGQLLSTPAVVGGSVTADCRRTILRDCSLEFAPTSDAEALALWDAILTPGVTVGLARGFLLPDATHVVAPLGIFVPDSPEMRETAEGMSLSLACTDMALKVQRARWTDPYQALAGSSLAAVLTDLLHDRYPPLPINISSSNCPETMGSGLVLEAGDSSDPWADAVNLAGAYGYALFVDVTGTARVQRISAPVPGGYAFTFARGKTAIVTEKTKSSPLEQTYSGVIASAEGSEVANPVRGESWDTNPASPTYCRGPFGKVPYFYSSSLMTTVDQCQAAADKMLAEMIGRLEAVSWNAVVHPGLQPRDVVALEELDGTITPYVIDTLTIPLDSGGTMSVVAREIRVDY